MHIDVIADGLGFTEGPVWLPDGRVALTSISHGCVYIVDPSGGPLERIDTGGGPNGLACGADGTLYVAQNGGAWGASGSAEAGVQVISGTRGRLSRRGTGRTERSDVRSGRAAVDHRHPRGVRHQHSRCRTAGPRVCDRCRLW